MDAQRRLVVGPVHQQWLAVAIMLSALAGCLREKAVDPSASAQPGGMAGEAQGVTPTGSRGSMPRTVATSTATSDPSILSLLQEMALDYGSPTQPDADLRRFTTACTRSRAELRNATRNLDYLACACRIRDSRFLRFLLDKGADVNARFSDGGTLLTHAVYWGCDDNVRLLLERGADVGARDIAGNTFWSSNGAMPERRLSLDTQFLLDDRLPAVPGRSMRAAFHKEVARAHIARLGGNPPDRPEAYATARDRISLYWDPVPGAIGYRVYRALQPGKEDYEHPISGPKPINRRSFPGSPKLIFTDRGLKEGTTYYYTVQSIFAKGSSLPSDETSDAPSRNAVPWDTGDAARIVARMRGAFAADLPDGRHPAISETYFGPDGRAYSPNDIAHGTVTAKSTPRSRP